MNELGLRIQARAMRSTWDRPRRFGSLPAALMGVALMAGALFAIAEAGGHVRELLALTGGVLKATGSILAGG